MLKITSNDFFVDNPQCLLDPLFKDLDSAEMKFVWLYTDFRSQYVRLPPDDRRAQAARACGFVNSDGVLNAKGESLAKKLPKKLEEAVSHYKTLQGDDLLQETIDGVTNAIKAINTELKQKTPFEDDISQLEKATKTIPLLYKLRDDMLKKLQTYVDMVSSQADVVEEKDDGSLLDEYL